MSEGRTFGLIGDPVSHSLSPRMHRAAFAALGIQAEYELRRVPAGAFDTVGDEMHRLGPLGGGNVTVPHKAAAALIVDEPSEVVTRLGACNCFWESSPGMLSGENTDVAGIRSVLESRNVRPERALVLGAGGAAAAACLALSEMKVASITVRNRTLERASLLAERLSGLDLSIDVSSAPPRGLFDVAINATSLGLAPTDDLPLDLDSCSPELILDLAYGRQRTKWTLAAEAAGMGWIDGREVLLEQGAACYEYWFGVSAPIEAMRGALFEDSD